jgi:hypothetical protein
MASLILSGSTSGSVTLSSPAVSGTTTLTLPATTGTVLTSASNTGFPAGSVLQVVSTTKIDTFSSATVNAWTDITGLSVSITPTSASNKILVMASVQGINTASNAYLRLVRGSTGIGVGTTSGSRSAVSSSNIIGSGTNSLGGSSFQFLDSPATTSSTTYKIQFITDVATTYVNRTSSDVDALYTGRSQSTITVMEIKG